MERAGGAAQKLDEFLGGMRGTGVLMQFNKEYKRRRTEATANGSGFMIYRVALGRLRSRWCRCSSAASSFRLDNRCSRRSFDKIF